MPAEILQGTDAHTHKQALSPSCHRYSLLWFWHLSWSFVPLANEICAIARFTGEFISFVGIREPLYKYVRLLEPSWRCLTQQHLCEFWRVYSLRDKSIRGWLLHDFQPLFFFTVLFFESSVGLTLKRTNWTTRTPSRQRIVIPITRHHLRAPQKHFSP